MKTTLRLMGAAFLVWIMMVHPVQAQYPVWWAERGAIKTNAFVTNDFLAVNQGQVKWIVMQAVAELDKYLPRGAGTMLSNRVGAFTSANNYLPVNHGQLKNITKPVYDRLIAEGYTNRVPWSESTNDDSNFSMANIGQVKNLYNFDLRTDSDADGLQDWKERHWFGDLTQSATNDADGDGLENGEEFDLGTSPTNNNTDGDRAMDGVEIGIGTDPTDPASFPVGVFGEVIYGGGQTGSIYVVTVTTAESWSTNISVHLAAPGLFAMTNFPNLTNYWVKSWLDSDGDGQSDEWESQGAAAGQPFYLTNDLAGLNITLTVPDTDADGMPDWWEVAHGLAPFDPADASEDADGDGYPNLYEYAHGANPQAATNLPVPTFIVTNGGSISIQQAIDDAATYDIIMLAPGRYVGNANKDLDFSGKRIMLVSAGGPTQTSIDCGGIGRGFDFHNGEDALAIVRGITVCHGNAESAGGMRFVNSSPLIVNCCMVSNIGGVYCEASAPTLRNCVIAANTKDTDGAGVYCQNAGALFENCTITDNESDWGLGRYADLCIMNSTNVTIRNCIIWGTWYGDGTFSVEYSDLSGGWAGCGNISSDPKFLNRIGHYGLQPDSPCRDAGTNEAGMVTGSDIMGDPRIDGAFVDMGAYECSSNRLSGYRRLVVSGMPQPLGASVPYDYGTNYVPYGQAVSLAVATPTSTGDGVRQNCIGWTGSGSVPVGGTSNGVVFAIEDDTVITWQWSNLEYRLTLELSGDGETDVAGIAWLSSGTSVIITATADAYWCFSQWTGDVPAGCATNNPLTVTMDQPRRITAEFTDLEPIHYVDLNNTNPVPPFISWDTAATNIADAVGWATDGNTVWVSNGVYRLNSSVMVGPGVRVQSVHGAGNTLVTASGGSFGCFTMDSGAELDGFTITGGHADCGGGVYGLNSTIANCIITNNTAVLGGGVYCWNEATIENCLISENHADESGGGIYFDASDWSLRNCTIAKNTATNGGGVAFFWWSWGIAENCILWTNTPDQLANFDYENSVIANCDIQGGVESEGNMDIDPQLVPGSYSLKWASPCIDAGCSNSLATDLKGTAHWDDPAHTNAASIWDLGVYEFVDNDCDRMDDTWEAQFSNLTHNANADDDADGLTNQEEYENNSNPLLADTDGDGLTDSEEVNTYHTNPLVADMDGDGLSDGVEVNTYHSNPSLKDTDGDGLDDGWEVGHGFDPNHFDATLPFTEAFETNTVVLGDVGGQNDWQSSANGEILVQTNVVHAGAQALQIKGGIPARSVTHPIGVVSPNEIWEDYYAQLAAWPIGSVPPVASSDVAVYFVDASNQMVVYDGTPHQWVTLTNTTVTTSGWVRLTLAENFTAQCWSVWLDGISVATNLGFANSVSNYSRFSAIGHPSDSTYLDDVHVSLNPRPEDVTDLHVEELGWGWARLAWTASVSTNAAGYKCRVIQRETPEGTSVWQSALMDIGNVTSLTLTNEPGYYFTVEIHVYDAWRRMTDTTLTTFGQNVNGIIEAKLIWLRLLGTYTRGPTWPIFATGGAEMSRSSNEWLFATMGADLLDATFSDDQTWMRVNGGDWTLITQFTPWISTNDITSFTSLGTNCFEFQANDGHSWLGDGGEYASYCCSPLYLVKVVPKVEIAMDANRDLQIDFNDPHDTTQGTNTFWINDNYDVNHWAGTGSESPIGWEEDDDRSKCNDKNVRDCDDDHIGRRATTLLHGGADNCPRDLEDFTLVQLKIPGVLSNLTGITYYLKLENCQGSPSINLFKAITNGVAAPFDYLTNSLVASSQVLETRACMIDTTEQEISTNYINRYDQPIGFLMEGCATGKADLAFVVKKDGSEICRSSVSLDLHPITDFFDKFQIGKISYTNTYTRRIMWSTRTVTHVTTPDKWQVEVETNAQQVQTTTAYEPVATQCLLYVNGWNVSEDQKTSDYETAYKRLWWQGYKGRFCVFDWPTLYGIEGKSSMISEHGRMNYDDSEMIAWLSSTAMARLMENLNSSSNLRVWAHSMGNAVMGEALRKYDATGYPKVKVYVASQAAIGASFYSQQTTPAAPFSYASQTTPNIMAYWSSGTNNGAQPYLVTNSSKVVSMINCYNVHDYALDAWNYDNKWKPDNAVGWGFNYGGLTTFYDENADPSARFYRSEDSGQRDSEGQTIYNTIGLDIIPDADLRPRYEVFAYCAESRLVALGAGTNSAFTGNVNLEAPPFNYDDTHYSHSKQFRSNAADQWPYYESLKQDCGF
jgi:hypothetical protein